MAYNYSQNVRNTTQIVNEREQKLTDCDDFAPLTKFDILTAKRGVMLRDLGHVKMSPSDRRVMEAAIKVSKPQKINGKLVMVGPTNKATVEYVHGPAVVGDRERERAVARLRKRGLLIDTGKINRFGAKLYIINCELLSTDAGVGATERNLRAGWARAYEGAPGGKLPSMTLKRTSDKMQKVILELARTGERFSRIQAVYKFLSIYTRKADRIVASSRIEDGKGALDRLLLEHMQRNRTDCKPLAQGLPECLMKRLSIWEGRAKKATQKLMSDGAIYRVEGGRGRGNPSKYELSEDPTKGTEKGPNPRHLPGTYYYGCEDHASDSPEIGMTDADWEQRFAQDEASRFDEMPEQPQPENEIQNSHQPEPEPIAEAGAVEVVEPEVKTPTTGEVDMADAKLETLNCLDGDLPDTSASETLEEATTNAESDVRHLRKHLQPEGKRDMAQDMLCLLQAEQREVRGLREVVQATRNRKLENRLLRLLRGREGWKPEAQQWRPAARSRTLGSGERAASRQAAVRLASRITAPQGTGQEGSAVHAVKAAPGSEPGRSESHRGHQVPVGASRLTLTARMSSKPTLPPAVLSQNAA